MLVPARILGLLLVLSSLGLDNCGGDTETVALGVLARERVVLTATANEIITGLPVSEGTHVTAGTVLVQLDDKL
jgi:HlyD family secretion protein